MFFEGWIWCYRTCGCRSGDFLPRAGRELRSEIESRRWCRIQHPDETCRHTIILCLLSLVWKFFLWHAPLEGRKMRFTSLLVDRKIFVAVELNLVTRVDFIPAFLIITGRYEGLISKIEYLFTLWEFYDNVTAYNRNFFGNTDLWK